MMKHNDEGEEPLPLPETRRHDEPVPLPELEHPESDAEPVPLEDSSYYSKHDDYHYTHFLTEKAKTS
eukprot:3780881-Pyramimonas_sp.AAC.1